MNLRNKKELAKKALGVGKHRIVFNQDSINEIKEAITKEDIKALHQEGVITIKPEKGRKKIVKRTTRKGPGKIKKKINKRKENYVKITRKLRAYVKDLKVRGIIDRALYKDIRKKIKMRHFKSKAYLQEYVKKATTIVGYKEVKKSVHKKAGKSRGAKK